MIQSNHATPVHAGTACILDLAVQRVGSNAALQLELKALIAGNCERRCHGSTNLIRLFADEPGSEGAVQVRCHWHHQPHTKQDLRQFK